MDKRISGSNAHQNLGTKVLLDQIEVLIKAGIWELNIKQNKLSWSDGVFQMLGYEPQEFEVSVERLAEIIHPDDREKASELLEDFIEGRSEYFIEKRLVSKTGNIIHVRSKANIFKDENGIPLKVVGVFQDITDFVQSQDKLKQQLYSTTDFDLQFVNDKLDEIEKDLMESSIKAEKSIQHLLYDYLKGIDSLFHGMRTSLTSIEDNRLKNFNSPNLPKEFLEEIENLPIGLNQGSCGTAAYLKQQVVVKDIYHDEIWEGYRELGDKYGFKSCWSEPIFNNKGAVIATFAIYNESVIEPNDLKINIFERAARLISLILQNFNHIKSIRESNERFKFINQATNNAIYDWNIKDDQFYWGSSLTRVFGHKIDEEKFRLRNWADWLHPDDLDEVLQNLDMFLASPDETKWSCEYRFIDVNGRYAYVEEVGYLIRDENGQGIRMIGALRDQTQYKQDQIKQELQYEFSQFFKKEKVLLVNFLSIK